MSQPRRVAYLVNRYPHPSHTFIRREIAGVEAAGLEVQRFSLRAAADLVDPADVSERERTSVVLTAGTVRLAPAMLAAALARPLRFVRALGQVVRLGRRSDRGVVRHLAYLAEACLLLGWLKRCRAEHLHVHFGTNSATVALLCRRLGGPPFSFTVHGPEEFDRPVEWSLAEKIEHAAFVVAISSYGRSQLLRWCPYAAWGKVHVVRCGVDAAFLSRETSVERPEQGSGFGVQGSGFREGREKGEKQRGEVSPVAHVSASARPRVTASPRLPEPRSQNREHSLVCVARLAEQKGLPVLLEAARDLAGEGRDFRLVLIGDGPLRGEIESLVRRFGLESHVELAGWRSGDRVRAAILASRALVLPSFAEGLPVVLMEALALGRPVVTTYVAGIPELVEPGVSGYLVPPGCARSLAAALRSVLDADPAELEAMGRAGRERVLLEHDSAREARRLADLFRRTIRPPQHEPDQEADELSAPREPAEPREPVAGAVA